MLSRRSFLRAATGAGLGQACALATFPAAAPAARPNIVIFLADDLSWGDIEPFGGQQVPTPHLAALARQGLCLDNMFTATAMCAPLRQQILTGLFPVRNGAYPNHSRVYDGVKGLPIYFAELGYRVGRAGKKHFGPDASFPFELIGRENEEPEPGHLEALDRFIRRDPQQPFCLWLASHQPHVPRDKGNPAGYPPGKLQVPPHLVDTESTRQAMSEYFAEVAWLDTQVGACLQLLDDAGHRDHTLFIFVSEHGSQTPFSKWTLYDAGLRAGCIVRWPGHVQPATRNPALTQYVDLLPTLIEAAGGVAPAGLDGKSILPVLRGKTQRHADYVYGIQTTKGIINGGAGYPIRSVRDRRYKFIRNLTPEREFTNVLTREGQPSIIGDWEKLPAGKARAAAYRRRPAEELYDLHTDPAELTNRAADPRLAKVKSRLAARLDAWMKQQNDLGEVTEARAGERHLQGAE